MKYIPKKLFLLLIAAVVVLSSAPIAWSYPLGTAVAVWNMDNNEDDNGPPYSNLDNLAASPADVTGTGIDGAEHFDGWAYPSSVLSWTEFTPPHELVPSGPVSILVRVRMAEFDMGIGPDDGIDAIHGIYDASCGTTVPSYAIEFHSGDPTFAVCAAGGTNRTTVSLGQVANIDTWYDILSVFDPDADELRLFVFDPATGSQIGSASVPVAFNSLITLPSSEIEVFCSPCDGLGIISGGFIELAAIWTSVVGPPSGGTVSITETDDSTDVAEQGPTSDTYTVVLDSEPADSVIITVDPDEDIQVNSNGAGNPIDLTFNIADWNTAQTVTVTAIDDVYQEGPETSEITHEASGDLLYTGIYIPPVIVEVADNDRIGDLVPDGYINLLDLMALTQQWLNECFADDWCGGADLSGVMAKTANPGIVDLVDFAIFASLWLDTGAVFITEFMAVNNSTLFDEDDDSSDWIEIYNASPLPIDLNDWCLTDDRYNLTKWCFPAITLDPYEYLVVFASGKDRAVPGSELHTNFQLNGDGEYLALVDPNGVIISHSYAPAYPEQYRDVSYGKGIVGYGYLDPTPGQANGQIYGGVVADTKFSVDRGFYNVPFQVEITTDTPGATIRYTLTYLDASSDRGKEPNETSGLVYSGSITMNQTTCLRAMAFKPGWLSTNVDTQTYIFLDDVLTQAADGNPPSGWPSSWGDNDEDYGMDPDIVDDPVWGPQMKDSLTSLPTISIVTDMDNLFDPTIGIYANALRRYREWERPCSMELINPDETEGFQANCGIRIRGGSSRDPSNPKHSLRFFFRGEYGPTRLRYPLFGNEGANWYDHIDLRTPSDHSWAWGGSSMFCFLHDVFSRDTQRDTGQEYTRSRYYHTYINGLYWGIYQSMEKPDDSYGQAYLRGNRDDYDAIKVSRCEVYCQHETFTIFATAGNLDAYERLWEAAMAGFATDPNYWRVMGCNPDGTRNPAYEILVDLDNLIDMLLVIFYTGNNDEPLSIWLGYELPNNIWALGNRNGGDGFMYFTHDNENSLNDCCGDETKWYEGNCNTPMNLGCNRTGPFAMASLEFKHFNPQLLHQELMVHPEYRMRFADRTHRHFFNNGALTDDACIARLNERVDEIDLAVIAESARWGDAQVSTPRDHDDWVSAVSDVSDFFPGRNNVVFNQIMADNLYPNIDAPSFSQHGGVVFPGFALTITNVHGSGTVYYTTDGNDPRLPGGAVAPGALTYTVPVVLSETANVKARVLDISDWSALNEAIFAIDPLVENLRITEIMYHPQDTGDPNDPNTEFIELKNIGPNTLNLNLASFTNGIHFTFPYMTLAPDEYVVVVKDTNAFTAKYGAGPNTAGQYTGRLDNGGERIRLEDAIGLTIHDFSYEDDWRPNTDGDGFSLTIINPTSADVNDWSCKNGWRPSAFVGGSPGADDSADTHNPGDIVINEVLAHSDVYPNDWIELHNTTDANIDISGWFLSDSDFNLIKYQISPGTIIDANGYIVFTQDDHFGSEFALSENGETAYLSSAKDANGNLTGYREKEDFGASENGVAFGRHRKSTGTYNFVAMSLNTLGAPNAYPKVGPVVINEIMYNPLSGDQLAEYVELYNITGADVNLCDDPNKPWKFTDGIDFTFPADANIPAYGYLMVVKDTATFTSEYGSMPTGVGVLGPYGGQLSNGGEKVEISMPGDVDQYGTPYYIRIDRVNYSDGSHPRECPAGPDLWPTEPDGNGLSLTRIDPNLYGNDPINWDANTPSPGN